MSRCLLHVWLELVKSRRPFFLPFGLKKCLNYEIICFEQVIRDYFVRFYCQSLDLRQQANHPAVRMVSEDGLFLHYIG